MKRRSYGRDAGLSLRMLFTTTLLGLLYVVFAVILFQVLNVGLVPMLVIVVALAFFQYYTSDKLALKASGAKIVERDEAPLIFPPAPATYSPVAPPGGNCAAVQITGRAAAAVEPTLSSAASGTARATIRVVILRFKEGDSR